MKKVIDDLKWLLIGQYYRQTICGMRWAYYLYVSHLIGWLILRRPGFLYAVISMTILHTIYAFEEARKVARAYNVQYGIEITAKDWLLPMLPWVGLVYMLVFAELACPWKSIRYILAAIAIGSFLPLLVDKLDTLRLVIKVLKNK